MTHWKKVVVLILFAFPILGANALNWETVRVNHVLDNKHFSIANGDIVEILGIDPPDLFFPTKSDRPLARKTFRLLKLLLENKEIKILEDQIFRSKNGIFPRHVKLDDGKYLSELLVENGFSRFSSDGENIKFDKKYKTAETRAKKDYCGIWGDTDEQKSLRQIRAKSSIAARKFRKKYAPFFAQIAVGRVEKVLSGDKIQLGNGLKIRLLGIQAPKKDESAVGLECFGAEAKTFLETEILGKTVWLQKDVSDLAERDTLLRYVFLPEEKISINEKMISNGFARSHWITKDKKFREKFEDLQLEIFENPRGAWLSCVEKILALPQKKEKKSYDVDQNCPVKGNISGTKKTFHTAESGWYERLQPEQCFETETAAIAAGFEKVK